MPLSAVSFVNNYFVVYDESEIHCLYSKVLIYKQSQCKGTEVEKQSLHFECDSTLE